MSSQDFVNQMDRFGESTNVYYSFPYDHSSEMNHHYQHQTPPYFNNCTGYLARPNHQQNLPMRIDMNMTAYVQRPPPLTHHEIYETTQLPIAPGPNSIILEPHRAFSYGHKLDMADAGFGDEKCRPTSATHHFSCVQQRKMENSFVCQKATDIAKPEPGNCSAKTEWTQSECSNFNGGVVKKSQSVNKICAKYQCFLCGKKYCRQSTLKAHLRQHSGEKPYVCNICGKNFSQSANLNAHRRVHTGEKPFSCPICSRPFSQSSSLMTHKRTHSGERPYQCSSCDKAFTDSSTLTKHVRTHTGFKPYSCRICHFSFSQSGNLNRHMKTHMKVPESHTYNEALIH